MFEGSDFPKPLDEALFEAWLEKGRASMLSYSYLLVVWDELEATYQPVFAESRDKLEEYEMFGISTAQESLIAAYDLYSESRIK